MEMSVNKFSVKFVMVAFILLFFALIIGTNLFHH